jgi:hypothetical protein
MENQSIALVILIAGVIIPGTIRLGYLSVLTVHTVTKKMENWQLSRIATMRSKQHIFNRLLSQHHRQVCIDWRGGPLRYLDL